MSTIRGTILLLVALATSQVGYAQTSQVVYMQSPQVVYTQAPQASYTQTICQKCGQVHSYRPAASSSLQAQAQAEAQMMASRMFKGHVRGTLPGVRFCGVGFSSSTSRAPTCTPGNGMTLVADAVARGRDGWYRVRYWR